MTTPGGSGRCAIAIMAKAPREGEVKTRLVPPLTAAEAMALSAAFIRDTAENILRGSRNHGDRRVRRLLAAGFGGGVRGGRTGGDPAAAAAPDRPRRESLDAAADLLAAGYSSACLVNADSPTLPTSVLVEAARCARNAGRPGRSRSGRGWRLLPYRPQAPAPPPVRGDRLEHRICVFRQTIERAAEIGLSVDALPVWYDVDDVASLRRLIGDLAAPDRTGYPAPHTSALLRRLTPRL